MLKIARFCDLVCENRGSRLKDAPERSFLVCPCMINNCVESTFISLRLLVPDTKFNFGMVEGHFGCLQGVTFASEA